MKASPSGLLITRNRGSWKVLVDVWTIDFLNTCYMKKSGERPAPILIGVSLKTTEFKGIRWRRWVTWYVQFVELVTNFYSCIFLSRRVFFFHRFTSLKKKRADDTSRSSQITNHRCTWEQEMWRLLSLSLRGRNLSCPGKMPPSPSNWCLTSR